MKEDSSRWRFLPMAPPCRRRVDRLSMGQGGLDLPVRPCQRAAPAPYSGMPNVVRHLSYSFDGRHLVASLGENGIRVFRTSDSQEVGRDAQYGDRSEWAEFDRTGRLVTTSDDGYVRLYDAEFGSFESGRRRREETYSARFSPDGSKVAVGFNDSTGVNVLSGRDLTFLYAPTQARPKMGMSAR